MDRRGSWGGRPGRPRAAGRGSRASLPSSSSSTFREDRDRWRPSPSQPSPPSITASEGKGGRKLLPGGKTVDERAEAAVDADTTSLVGTCPDMCPAKERAQREQLRDLAVFERVDGNPGRTSPTLAVKKFCRTISAMHVNASDIRPLPVLQKTLGYLLDLVDCSDQPFEVIHDFVFDRSRSIRQDLSVQNIVNNEVIHMYEEMEGDSISLWFRKMELSILQSKEMKFVRSVLRCFRMGNYGRFFKTIAAESSYLQFCLLEPVINEVRAWALSYIIYGGYKLHPYPLADLSHVLMMKESDLESLCHACGLETSKDEAGCLFLPTKQMGFHTPKAFQSFSLLNSESVQRWGARDERLKHPGCSPSRD